MSFSFIKAVSNSNDAAGTTLDTSASLNVAVGDLLVAWCTNESGSTTRSIAKNSGSPANNFSFDAGDAINHTDGALSGQFGYLLSAAADATATFRLTTTSKDIRRVIIAQYRPDAGATVTKDKSANSATNASGISAVSGNVTTTGTDEVAVGGYGQDSGATLSSMAINAIAATEPTGSPIPAGAGSHLWYRLLLATFAGGNASGTQSSGGNYVMGIISFKSIPGATAGNIAWVTA